MHIARITRNLIVLARDIYGKKSRPGSTGLGGRELRYETGRMTLSRKKASLYPRVGGPEINLLDITRRTMSSPPFDPNTMNPHRPHRAIPDKE